MFRTGVRARIGDGEFTWSSSRPAWHGYEIENKHYISWEADAHRVQEWAVMRIPDLLHTEDYTRALFNDDWVFRANHTLGARMNPAGRRQLYDEIRSRKDRQERLANRPDYPLNYTAVVDESVLHKMVGSPKIMRHQLHMLIDCAGWTDVALRVLPATTAPPIGTTGGFTILEFPGGIEPAMMFAQYPGGVVSEHDRHLVDQAQQRFDAVLSAALPVHDSMEFIEQLADEIYPQ